MIFYREYDYSNKNLWDLNKYDKYIDIGLYPNSISLFMEHREKLLEIFNPIADVKMSAEKRFEILNYFAFDF